MWKVYKRIRFFFYQLLSAVPSSPPDSPKCDVLSSTSLYVTWSPPSIEGRNGKIKGYKVSYIASEDLYEKDPMVAKTTNQYLTIENLKKYTNYSVWVLAFTKSGDGVKTNPLFCTTHEDGRFSFPLPKSTSSTFYSFQHHRLLETSKPFRLPVRK
jgi:Fibronectin type III domain